MVQKKSRFLIHNFINSEERPTTLFDKLYSNILDRNEQR